MRHVWISKAGPPEVLELREAPDPQPGPGEVRVRVAAVGVNFADVVGRQGLYADAPHLPYVPGYEVAGQIDLVGADVEGIDPGDEVIAVTKFGGYTDMLCVPAAQVIPRPAGIDVQTGAGLCVAGFTAYMGLHELARVRAGDHVLIHAAAGGVGLMAVALCRMRGATIYGTASAHKHDFLREQGVQFPIDYNTQDFVREIKRLTDGRGVDVALDTIGGRSWIRSYRALAPLGRLVCSGVTALTPTRKRSILAVLRFLVGIPWFAFNPPALANANKGVMGVNLANLWDQHALFHRAAGDLFGWIKAGQMQVHVDRTFPLAEAAAAHEYIQSRQSVGKIVLIP